MLRISVLTLALIIASQTAAQTAQEAQPEPEGPSVDASELSAGETIVDGRVVGEPYLRDTFGSWEVVCITTADGSDPCVSSTLVQDEGGNSIARFEIEALAGVEGFVAAGRITAPLESLLEPGVQVQVDDGPVRRFPFRHCTQSGCIARPGLTEADIDGFKAGANALLALVPHRAPNNQVVAQFSLTGFTAAYDALTAQ